MRSISSFRAAREDVFRGQKLRLKIHSEVEKSPAAEAGKVVLKVTDNGTGMSADVKRQAFEPFFTTRSPGEGSGLGLAIVASIVRAHEGSLTLTSEIGKGTEIELRLPVKAGLLVEAELGPITAHG